MKTSSPTRRHFFRAAGTVIALPALESIGFRRFAAAATAVVRPKRVVFLGFGWGVTEESWYPDAKVVGADFKLPPGLAPLARHMMRHHHSLTALILVLGGVMVSARAITPADIAAIPRQELVDSLYVVCGKTLLVISRKHGRLAPHPRHQGRVVEESAQTRHDHGQMHGCLNLCSFTTLPSRLA